MRRPPADDPTAREKALAGLFHAVDAHVRAYAEAHPDEPAEDWLYRELDTWTELRADRDDGLTVLPEPACRAGCDHCCQQGVMLTPLEAHFLADWIRSRWSGPEVDRLREVSRARWDQLRLSGFEGLNLAEQAAALSRIRRPCPLLDETSGLCRAYEARPLACRREHSLDAEVCRRHRDDPDAPLASVRVPGRELAWNAARRLLLTWMESGDPAELYLPLELALMMALETD